MINLVKRLLRKPTPDDFAKLVIKRLRQHGIENEIEYDRSEFRLTFSEDHHLLLGNVYQEYQRLSRGERTVLLDRYISGWTAPPLPESYETARAGLLPRIQSVATTGLLEFQFGSGAGGDFLYKEFANGLVVSIVYDSEHAIAHFKRAQIEKWGVPFDELLRVACSNLRERSQERFLPIAEGVFRSPWQDSHDAGRLCLPELFYRIQISGKPVAMAPNRDLVLVAGSNDPAGLANLAAIGVKEVDHLRVVSGDVFILDGEQWMPFRVGRDHPAYRNLKDARIQVLARNYGDQKDFLDKLHDKGGTDISVGSVMVVTPRDGGEKLAISAWAKDSDTLLPVTERIALVATGEEPVIVEWDRAVEIVGDLMEKTELLPARFRVRSFPDDVRFAELKRVAVGLSQLQA